MAIEPPPVIDVSSGYSSPALGARIAFDYSNNDGRFTLGQGEMTFITAWSKASNTSIHAYKDAPGMQSVSLAIGLKEISGIDDASSFDPSSRVRTAQLGDIIIWRNARGYYAATKVERIKDRTRGDDKDELVFSYRIQSNGTTSFRSP
jgi:hypothetical protein